jgi:hypothetical protein
MQQAVIAFNNGDLAAESSHRLRRFHADVTTANHDQVFRGPI